VIFVRTALVPPVLVVIPVVVMIVIAFSRLDHAA
jgi:hypothetical protein